MRKQIMDMCIDDVSLEQAVEHAMACVHAGQLCRVVTPNAEFALAAKKDRQFLEAINTSDLILPDGISVVLAAKIIGRPLAGKVAGVDFGDALCHALACEGKSLYMLGAREGVAERAAQKLAEKHPGLSIAGVHHGYFKDDEVMADAVAQAGADVLFVALGAPRQEYFMQQYGHRLGAKVMVGLGGSLDVFAGDAKRAPNFFIRLGLEWLYRLAKEPWRFKRMIKLPLYLLDAAVYRLRNGKPKN